MGAVRRVVVIGKAEKVDQVLPRQIIWYAHFLKSIPGNIKQWRPKSPALAAQRAVIPFGTSPAMLTDNFHSHHPLIAQ